MDPSLCVHRHVLSQQLFWDIHIYFFLEHLLKWHGFSRWGYSWEKAKF
jgi:hypothetical protein